MRKTHTLILIALLSSLAFAGQAELLQPRTDSREGYVAKTAKRADVVRVVPHLAASNDWKSLLILRNDLNRAISMSIDLYGPDGAPASAVFYDSDDVMYETDRFDLTLNPFEIYTLEFDHMTDPGLFNMQAYIFTDELDQEYSVENVFSNFQGADKVAAVGGGLQAPGDNFFMNVDERVDAYTLNDKLRGLAVTNIETEPCTCSVVLWDHAGNEASTATVLLDPLAKWVGTVASLVNTNNLSKRLGLLDFDCDRLVAVTGLSFENGTPIVGSTPIDYYTFENGKRKTRR